MILLIMVRFALNFSIFWAWWLLSPFELVCLLFGYFCVIDVETKCCLRTFHLACSYLISYLAIFRDKKFCNRFMHKWGANSTCQTQSACFRDQRRYDTCKPVPPKLLLARECYIICEGPEGETHAISLCAFHKLGLYKAKRISSPWL